MRKGTDQCNINVSISTKLSSSSSRENSIAAPVNMTLSNMIPALNSPSSLSDNIFRIETQTYPSSPGVMTEENSDYKLRGRCVCVYVHISPRIQLILYEYYIDAPSKTCYCSYFFNRPNGLKMCFIHQSLYLIVSRI